MNPKISIVTSYFDRKPQFLKMLEILDKHPNKNFEVIVVDDGSEPEHDLEGCLNYSFKTTLIKISPEQKTYVNPCVPFNLGFAYAQGDKIIIQNPECLHAGDLISVAENLEENHYASFPCYSLDPQRTQHICNEDISTLSFEKITSTLKNLIYSLPQISADESRIPHSVWYNHPEFRPQAYHFAAAICKKDLEDLGGFDERYAQGKGWDDDEFCVRIKRKGMKIDFHDQPVIHLWHSRAWRISPAALAALGLSSEQVDDSGNLPTPILNDAIYRIQTKNELIYETITKKETGWRVNRKEAGSYIVHPPTVFVSGGKF